MPPTDDGEPGDGERDFLYLKEVAADGQMTMKVVLRLVHSGELPAVRIGRRYRVKRADFDRLMREGTGPA